MQRLALPTRLRLCKLNQSFEVREAANGDRMLSSRALITQGGKHMDAKKADYAATISQIHRLEWVCF